MQEVHFTNLLIVTAVAFAAPLLLGFAPALRLPAVVLEIVAGIVVGPSVLGWVDVDVPLDVLAVIGLAFLLFLAGLEIDPARLRGRALRVTSVGFALSFVIGIGAGLALNAGDFVKDPMFAAIVLVSTSLGVVVPVLKDSDEIGSDFGQLVIAAASIADFGAIILLTLFFSGEASTGTSTKLILLGGFGLTVAALAFALTRAEHSMRISRVLVRLQDTTAQIRVRGAFVLLIGFAALAEQLGLETILGAFAAGALLSLIDRDERMTHPEFRLKLEAAGFGIFIPIFFVTSGVRFDLDALFSSAEVVLRVPVFLLALLAVRGLPALLYRGAIGTRKTVAAALLQATSLPFIVAATMIGQELGVISGASAAAFIAAGLLSVVAFPVTGLALLRPQRGEGAKPPPPTPATAVLSVEERALCRAAGSPGLPTPAG
jgi:Kef-type K+ transport system membrane component KefB